jgi:hypothetical protein
MKKCIMVLITLISCNIICHAQEADQSFKPFQVKVGIGVADSPGSNTSGNDNFGFLFTIEPQYAIIDQFSVGLRLESALTGSVSTNGSSASSIAVSGSYLATGNYYFTTTTFRPFVGAGIGLFKSVSGQDTSNSIVVGYHFGGMIRAGFNLSHFWMDVEYNLIPTSQSDNLNHSYLGIKLGVYFGGGKLD